MIALTFVGEWPAELRDAGERVLAALQEHLGEDLPTGTINLKLVDDTASKALNTDYNGNAYATDVLTFDYSESGSAPEGELADVAISTETAARQAEAAQISLADEIGLLIAHGILHVLGYDHQQTADQQRLDQLQRQLLAAAGLTYREFSWKP